MREVAERLVVVVMVVVVLVMRRKGADRPEEDQLEALLAHLVLTPH